MRGKLKMFGILRLMHMLCGMLIMAWAVSAQAAPLPETLSGGLSDAMETFGVQLPRVQKSAPDFILTDLKGEHISLVDLRGQLVLLHFWATWCIPCRHEMPLLHGLEHTMQERSFRILCVNVDRGDSETVQTFMDEVSPGFHTLLDPDGLARNQYAVRGLPTSYLIAPDGKIIGRIIGERDWNSSEAIGLFRRVLVAYGG